MYFNQDNNKTSSDSKVKYYKYYFQFQTGQDKMKIDKKRVSQN